MHFLSRRSDSSLPTLRSCIFLLTEGHLTRVLCRRRNTYEALLPRLSSPALVLLQCRYYTKKDKQETLISRLHHFPRNNLKTNERKNGRRGSVKPAVPVGRGNWFCTWAQSRGGTETLIDMCVRVRAFPSLGFQAGRKLSHPRGIENSMRASFSRSSRNRLTIRGGAGLSPSLDWWHRYTRLIIRQVVMKLQMHWLKREKGARGGVPAAQETRHLYDHRRRACRQ